MARKNKEIDKKAKIRIKVKNLLAEIARVDANLVKEETKIREDLGVDSLTSVEILAAIEVRLGIMLDQAKAFDVVTVKDLIDLIISQSRP